MNVESPGRRIGLVLVRAIGVGAVGTLAAAALALLVRELRQPSGADSSVSSVAIFMLAVTVSAVTGGLWAGVAAAVFSSVALPALESQGSRDIVAAVVFLAIAVVVGLVVGSAADERDRASRREQEARLLAHLSTRLLSGDLPDRVLDDFVKVLLVPFGLAACQVAVSLDGTEVRARAESGRPLGGPSEVVPVVVSNIPLGTLIAERPPRGRPFTRDERLLLEAATRQAAVALDRARLEARARLAQLDAETSQLRAAMFSSVTHDLRTPLASIKASVTSLLDAGTTHDADQQRDLLTTVLEETDRLNRLVGNILDLARIRAGALIPRMTPTALDEVAEYVVARSRARLGNVKIELQISPELPEVSADPVQLDQVLTNLLENAAQHSPRGGTVRIHVAHTAEAVRARVADEGPGIAREEREKVFEAFYRGRHSPESAGSGLGLAIAKAIVTAHGGRIWVEETTGGGTAMVFEIPIDVKAAL